MKFLLLMAASLIATIGSAQGPIPLPGGGSGGGGSTGGDGAISSDPQDIDNWLKVCVKREGFDDSLSWSYGPDGQPKSTAQHIPWALTGQLMIPIGSNGTYLNKTVTASSAGQVAYTFTWQGLGLSPKYLWIRETAGANTESYWPGITGSGDGSASNGLGHQEVRTPSQNYLRVTSSGDRYRIVPVKNGVAECEVSLNASASMTGPTIQWTTAYASAASNYDVVVSPRSLKAWPYGYEVTYGKRLLTGPENVVSYPWGSYQKAIPALNEPYNNDPTTIIQHVDFALNGVVWLIDDDIHGQSTHHINFGGVATPALLNDNQLSHYLWTFDESGQNLAHAVPWSDIYGVTRYDISDVGTTYEGYTASRESGTLSKGDAEILDLTKLQYTWSDGVSLLYILGMNPHLPVENHQNYGTVEDLPSIQSSDYGDVSGWVDHNQMTKTFTAPLEQADFRAAAKSAQLTGKTIKDLIKPVWMKLTLTFLDALLGSATAPTMDSRQRGAPDDHFPFAVDRARAGDLGWMDVIPDADDDVNSQVVQHMYDWKITQHKLFRTDYYVVDRWGSQGYLGQDDGQFVMWQFSFEELFKYRYNGGGPPYGGM